MRRGGQWHLIDTCEFECWMPGHLLPECLMPNARCSCRCVVRHSLAHRVLLEFIDACELLEQQTGTGGFVSVGEQAVHSQKRQWSARRLELLHSLQPHLLALVHTQAGARLAILVISSAAPEVPSQSPSPPPQQSPCTPPAEASQK